MSEQTDEDLLNAMNCRGEYVAVHGERATLEGRFSLEELGAISRALEVEMTELAIRRAEGAGS